MLEINPIYKKIWGSRNPIREKCKWGKQIKEPCKSARVTTGCTNEIHSFSPRWGCSSKIWTIFNWMMWQNEIEVRKDDFPERMSEDEIDWNITWKNSHINQWRFLLWRIIHTKNIIPRTSSHHQSLVWYKDRFDLNSLTMRSNTLARNVKELAPSPSTSSKTPLDGPSATFETELTLEIQGLNLIFCSKSKKRKANEFEQWLEEPALMRADCAAELSTWK